MKDFFDLVIQGFRLAANLAGMAKDACHAALQSYFKLAKRCTIKALIFSGVAFVTLLVMMATNVPPGVLHAVAIAAILASLAWWLLVLFPVVAVALTLRRHLPAVYEVFAEPLRLYRSVLTIVGASLVTFVAVPFWKEPDMLWLGLAILFSALLLPSSALSSKLKGFLPTLQVLQVVLMAFLLFLRYAYPTQARNAGQHLKQWFGRFATGWTQKDITQDWRSIREWFDDAGNPLIWYSGNDVEGYRLWKSAGFDRMTGEKLKQVNSTAIQQLILQWLKANEPPPRPAAPPRAASGQLEASSPSRPDQAKQDLRTNSSVLETKPRQLQTGPSDDVRSVSPKQEGAKPPSQPIGQWEMFSAAALEIVATDLLGVSKERLAERFKVECASASHSRRGYKGFGVSSDVVVVNARFVLSATTGNVASALRTKSYETSESIFADQFRGLNDPDTIERISQALRNDIKKDEPTLVLLQSAFK